MTKGDDVTRGKYTVTIDHCCLIALENREDDAPYVEALIDAWKCGWIDLAVCAIGASENAEDGLLIEVYDDYSRRLKRVGLEGVREIYPVAHFGRGFWGKSAWGGDQDAELEKQITEMLFPNPNTRKRVSRNRFCDVNLVLANARARREFLVTTDKKLIKKQDKLQDLIDVGKILTPRDFLHMLG